MGLRSVCRENLAKCYGFISYCIDFDHSDISTLYHGMVGRMKDLHDFVNRLMQHCLQCQLICEESFFSVFLFWVLLQLGLQPLGKFCINDELQVMILLEVFLIQFFGPFSILRLMMLELPEPFQVCVTPYGIKFNWLCLQTLS